MTKKYYALSTILKGVKQYLDERIKNKKFWLKAEISNISFHRSGHCYIDLVETKDGILIAQIKGAIWNYSIQDIKNELGSDFNNILKIGTEVLFYSELSYSEIYGLQINITSVDKSFNLGELERKKQETINRLKEEELLDINKAKYVPSVIQTIALIGSPNTSGHTDFIKQIKSNDFGFDFKIVEFHCQVQGDKAEIEILNKLKEIRKYNFDVVVILRGGGSKLDLEVFNSYNIATEIANYPLPVFTGIGHETDFSVVDFVSNKNFKTPSAVGSYIVDKAYQYYVKVTSYYNYIMEYYNKFMLTYKKDLFANTQYLHEKSISITRLKRGELHTYSNRLISNIRERINQESSILNIYIENLYAVSKFTFNENRRNLDEMGEIIKILSNQITSSKSQHISQSTTMLMLLVTTKLKNEKAWIENVEEIPNIYSPVSILKKGYALVRIQNHVLTPKSAVKIGDEIEVEFIDKKIIATVTKYKDNG